MKPVRVVVVDDHPLMRASLTRVVDAQPGFEVVGEAEHAREAFEVVARTRPNLLLLDVAMPDMDGIDFARKLRLDRRRIQIILVTMHEEDGTLRRAIALGAEGYVPKSAPPAEIRDALHVVADGGTYISPSIAGRMMELMSGRGSHPIVTLTKRELEILRLLSTGYRVSEIAEELYVTPKTVKNHLTNVYAKLDVETASQAVALAYRLGLVSPDDVPVLA